MRRKTNYIEGKLKSPKNNGNREFFITPTDVGEIWKSKIQVKIANCYEIHLSKNKKIERFSFSSTKDYTEKLIKKLKSISTFSYIEENNSEYVYKDSENIYLNHPFIFLNFLDIDLTKKVSVETFVHKYGLLGDPDKLSINKENIFSKSKRIEPIALWEYEQGCLQYAYDLWEEIKLFKGNPEKLLLFFRVNKQNQYEIKSNYSFEENFTKSGNWTAASNHNEIIDVAKNLVSLIIQDHIEHRISFNTNFTDFNTPTPILETDSLLAVIWLSFLKYIQEGYKEIKKCRQCNYKFNAVDKRKEFCSKDCKIKYHNNK